jgi:branched-chain amino acid transport system permease protein
MLWNMPFSILLILSVLIGLFINWIVVELIKKRLAGMAPLTTLLIFFGLGFILEGVMSYVWGVRQRTLIIPYLESMIGLLSLKDILIISLTVSVYLILIFFFLKTKQGIAIRAMTQNRKGALICGINVFTVYRLISLIGGAACGLAGSLLAIVYSFYPAMGTVWIAYLFFIVVVGGKGSILGSLVGGLVLGILQSLTGILLPLQWTEVILFLGLILILVVRPQGLFGG